MHADEARRRSAMARDRSGEVQKVLTKLWQQLDAAVDRGWVGYRVDVPREMLDAIETKLLEQLYCVQRESGAYGMQRLYISWPEL